MPKTTPSHPVRPHLADRPLTLVHVTHEAVEHMGGIGTVLAGLMTALPYQHAVARSIFVGPLPWPDRPVRDPLHRLGEYAVECLYSGPDSHDPHSLGSILRPIEWAFGTPIVYGKRSFDPAIVNPSTTPTDPKSHPTAEVLLFDLTKPDPRRLAEVKFTLFERFGLDSHRYEHAWDYEEWVRLAGPAYHALAALLRPEELPAVVLAHEFMGMATALLASTDRTRFRTAFHAHECSTARRLVEVPSGHDCSFYPALRRARAAGRSFDDVFGDESSYSRHALVSRSHHLDAILAVGDPTAEELRFLSPRMDAANVRVCYNGVPSRIVTPQIKSRARDRVLPFVARHVGFMPDFLITHVTRPVVSKGLWRDLQLLAHLEPHLARAGKRAAYLLLTCGSSPRSPHDIASLASRGWPGVHHDGYPDLDGVESHYFRNIQAFHASHPAGNIRCLMINQFGFDRARVGPDLHPDADIHDLRAAADAELGLSVYEPFGISPLEPLAAGAVCVVSSVSGCVGLAARAARELALPLDSIPNLLVADYTLGADDSHTHMSHHERDRIEQRTAAPLAAELFHRLHPQGDPTDHARRLLEAGQKLAARMSWTTVCETDFLPAIRSAIEPHDNGSARVAGAA